MSDDVGGCRMMSADVFIANRICTLQQLKFFKRNHKVTSHLLTVGPSTE